MSPTARAAPSVDGKRSRVMPRNETTRAQTAKSAPQTWKAFTRGNLAEGRPEAPGLAGCARDGVGVFTDMSQPRHGGGGSCGATPPGPPIEEIRPAVKAPR